MNHSYRTFAVVLALLGCSSPLCAADLSNLQQTIIKQPAYHSPPKYCLLLFGLGTESRVWLVHDGDDLYVDRNGNGDLTEDGERVQAKRAGQGSLFFELGDVPNGECVHKQLRIVVEDLKHVSDLYDEANVLVARNPEARMYKLWLESEVPGFRGTGAGGRIKQRVNAVDRNGVLQFGGDPANAPMINFAGVWQFLLEERPRLVAGRRADVFMAIGTPGIGPGTTAYFAHEGLVPESARPLIAIAFPPNRAEDSPLEMRYAESDRGCVDTFHATIAVPDGAGAGLAAVTLSLAGCKEAQVIPSEEEVEIRAPRPGPPVAPVSSRLVRSLMHRSRRFRVANLRFSPDGGRIIGGGYLTEYSKFGTPPPARN